MSLEAWIWEHATDWLDGRPGADTLARLRAAGADDVPADLLVYLGPHREFGLASPLFRRATQLAADALKSEEVQRRGGLAVSRALDDAGVPHVFYKGLELSGRVYPSRNRRTSNDIDLLVAPEARVRAVEALVALDGTLSGPADAFRAGRHHEVSVTLPEVSIDVHVAPLQPGRARYDAAGVIARKELLEIDGGVLPVPARTDSLALCLVHIGRHEGAGEYVSFKHGLDLALMLRRWQPIEWDALARTVRDWRCSRLAGAALWTWRPRLGALVPDGAARALDPGVLQRRLAARTRDVLPQHLVRARGAGRLSQLVRKFLFAEGARERLWLLGELALRARGGE